VILLGAALVLAGDLAGGCPAPRLHIALSRSDAKQGAILVVRLGSDADLARASAVLGGHTARLEPAEGARAFRGVVGIDFESATGREPLRVDVEGLCADAHSAAKEIEIRSGRFAVEKLTVAPAYVEPPESERDRIKEDHEKVERVWKTGDAGRRWSEPFRLPVDAPVRERSFGSRRVFNGEPRSPHSGLDLAAREGQEVSAPAPARVALAEELYFSGGTVILDHGAGLFTSYFHLSRIDVRVGDVLAAGGRVGSVGSTGRATGPHLHWSARLDGARVNPLGLLKLPSWRPPSPGDSLTGQSP
jgi:murein DD-endopeptidase MepM/ murein hydrolase activator NlpD